MRWAVVVFWMAVIFYFSAQSGAESGGLSGWVVDALGAVVPMVDSDVLSVAVRKGAHVAEYAVLGALLTWALRGRAAWAIPVGVVYAATDEIHQLFVPGRAGQVSDVLIDSLGVALGVALVLLVRARRRALD